MGTLRLNCNWDYDKLREIANNHQTLRLMLGHGILDRTSYALQTLRDNVCRLTPEVLERIKRIKNLAAAKMQRPALQAALLLPPSTLRNT